MIGWVGDKLSSVQPHLADADFVASTLSVLPLGTTLRFVVLTLAFPLLRLASARAVFHIPLPKPKWLRQTFR
eukprot:2995209-Heterocapsa_arctica.AAC.1